MISQLGCVALKKGIDADGYITALVKDGVVVTSEAAKILKFSQEPVLEEEHTLNIGTTEDLLIKARCKSRLQSVANAYKYFNRFKGLLPAEVGPCILLQLLERLDELKGDNKYSEITLYLAMDPVISYEPGYVYGSSPATRTTFERQKVLSLDWMPDSINWVLDATLVGPEDCLTSDEKWIFKQK